jgi:segregation and condensation protein B
MSEDHDPEQNSVREDPVAETTSLEAVDSMPSSDTDSPLPDSGLTEILPDPEFVDAETGGRLSEIVGGRLSDGADGPLTDPTANRLAEALAGLSDEADGDADAPAEEVDGDGQKVEAAPQASDQELTTERVIEAILFATDTPLTLPKIVSILGVGSARDVRKHINALNQRYDEQGSAFRVEIIAGGYQMLTRAEYNTWLRRLRQNKQDSRLSQAAMETLAVVAYKQPVVRAEIEAIRGVQSGEMLNRLRELGLVKIVGRAEDVGRPMLYGTTKRFLEVFGLSGLEDLPEVEELKSNEE